MQNRKHDTFVGISVYSLVTIYGQTLLAQRRSKTVFTHHSALHC